MALPMRDISLQALASTAAQHLVKVADVVRKANSTWPGHRCAGIYGSMKAYESESASRLHAEQSDSRQRQFELASKGEYISHDLVDNACVHARGQAGHSIRSHL
jgi:hypothetical protein